MLHGAGAEMRDAAVRTVEAALRPGADAAGLATASLAALAQALRQRSTAEDPVDSAIALARERLAAGAIHPLDLRRLARETGLTYPAFRRRFVAAVGMPPRQCEILARLGRARELLAAGGGVAAVAAACGFASPFYFSRRFKAAFGVPPSACIA
jgi:AraC family transcriptional regulator of arabinose operon